MKAPIVRTILAFCMCAAFSCPAGAQNIGNSNEERAQFLLERLEQQLGKIRNFRCQKVTPVFVLAGTPDQRIVEYRHVWLASDQRGRGRIRTVNGPAVDTQIWDGQKTIEYRQEVDPNGTITHTVFAARGRQYQTQRQDEPWVYLGRDLTRLLSEALDSGRRTRVTRTNTGQFRLDIRDDAGAVHAVVVDPDQGYAPVFRRVSVDGEVQTLETTTFQEVDPGSNPGVWFPVAVASQVVAPDRAASETSVLKCRFSDIAINDDRSFENLLKVGFAEGTAVQDRASGRVYVVGEEPLDFLERPAWIDVNDTPAPVETGPAPWRAVFEAAYRLENGEILKCITPPFIPERGQYLQDAAPPVAGQGDGIGRDQFYHFVWDNELEGPELLGPSRSLALATVIERVIGLASYEYEGTAHLLRLRLAGDWVVRKDASTEELLAALGQIVKDQTQWSIGFAEQQADAIVIRSSGTYRFATQPEIPGSDGVHVFAGDWNAQRDATAAGSDCGTVAELLDHVADRIGMRIVDATQSSDVELCWATHESSQLRDQRSASRLYNTRLASLLNNLTSQTGLVFTMELGTVSRWQVSTQRGLTARSN